MRYGLLSLIAAVALGAPAQRPPEARELVRQSIRNGERAWRNSFDYYCVKRDVDRQFDSGGKLKTTDNDVYQIIPLGDHASFEELIQHDNEPVPRDRKLKDEKELQRLQAETPGQKQRRFEKLESERSYMKEVPDAFDFRIKGEDNLPTGRAWVLEATPRPGFHPKSRYAHMFPYMRGTLWIDEKDLQWVKADAVATSTVSFGFFIARLAKGSHIVIRQIKLPDGSWVAKQIEAQASARTFLVFTHNFEENITYSDYHKNGAMAAREKSPGAGR
ncbi:MAG: hypothetical protein LAQ30_05755 [Acidobacteriia bacterium]|nr:hypothetical protein [Terriglobia bacterium]